MTQPPRLSSLQKQHAALWYDFASYRLAWLILPQAFVAAMVAVFLLGGGIADFSFGGTGGGKSGNNGKWATTEEMEAGRGATEALFNAVADNNDAGALKELQAMAAAGNTRAASELATLYDPYNGTAVPYPTDKDVDKALQYSQVAADAGDGLAFGNISRIRLALDTPQYDPVIGCDYLRKYMARPEMAIDKLTTDDAWYAMNMADCYSGVRRAKDIIVPELNAEEAVKAIEYYNLPMMKDYYDIHFGLAQLYLVGSSPVFDRTKGCAEAKLWARGFDLATLEPDPTNAPLFVETVYCLLGIDGYRDGPDYRPAPEDEKLVTKLLDQPFMAEKVGVVDVIGWFYLNNNHSLYDVNKGCDAVYKWAELTGGTEEETARFTSWSAWNFASCLLSTRWDVTPFKPTETQIKIGMTMLEQAVAADDPGAKRHLGWILDRGPDYLPKDQARALSLFQQCAEQGEAGCHENLGNFKQFGLGGLAVDMEGAIAEFRLCAKQGITSCDAALVSFNMSEGDGGTVTNNEAFVHLQTAVDAQEPFGLTLYGVAYLEGLYGLRRDPEEAALWFVKAFASSNGRNEVNRFAKLSAPLIKEKAFWKAMHEELTRRGVYSGPISSKMNDETLAAAAKLTD